MSSVHFHLIVSHFPIVTAILSLPLCLFAWWRGSETWKRLVLVMAVLAGLFVLPTFFSGERAGEILEHQGENREALIKAHEEAAEAALWVILIPAALALFGLFLALKKPAIPPWLFVLVMIGLLASAGTQVWVGNLGGKIGHPELTTYP